MPYKVLIKESARRELSELPKRDRERIEGRIESLEDHPLPSGVKALQGKMFKGLYRLRVGNYRIVYQVEHDRLIVLVIKIGDRKDVYD